MISPEVQSLISEMKSFISLDRSNLARAVEFNISKLFEKLNEKLDSDKSEIINLLTKKSKELKS